MSRPIVSIGEILFDCFGSQKALGGAPTNFAGHVAALGKSVALISAIGRDDLGAAAYDELDRRGIDMRAVSTNNLPTGTVDVELIGGEPKYTINQPAAWDAIELSKPAIDILKDCVAVCFGTLAQRDAKSKAAIRRTVGECGADAMKLLDVNLRQPFYDDVVIRESVALANAVKMNDAEVPIVAKALGINANETGFASELLRKFGIKFLIVTAGAKGATLYRGDEVAHVDAIAVNKMVNTVGAGDSFTAAATCALLDGQPLEQIGRQAAQLAAATCEYAGGLPPY